MTKPTLDPLLSLAFSIHSNPGVYALLLGSGISRAASIPTGWDVVLELVRKVATLQSDDCGTDPAGWYAAKFGEDPDYGKLLKQVAKRPAERQSLLRSYFEANDDERAAGLKQPTKAHEAIAALVRSGHIRVVITTNFDRLMEQSLEAIGISPTVISTGDAADGATPLSHAKCTVVKLHGDYHDARIRNTPDELAKYDKRMNKLLDRVFDEFGLIVSGWSAEWDLALRTAMQRCKSRRYTTYWSTFAEPSQATKDIVQLRGAQMVGRLDADSLFTRLQQNVAALAEFNRPHPLSVATAVAMTKRLLASSVHRIELRDLVHRETEGVVTATTDSKMPCDGVQRNADGVRHRMLQYEAIIAKLQAVFISGCYWGGEEELPLWMHVIERIGGRDPLGGATEYINLRCYPALMLLYAGGLAAISRGNYRTLKAILLDTRVRKLEREMPACDALTTYDTLEYRAAQSALQMPKHHTPLSQHLFELLRDPLREYLPDDARYEASFDRFEYMVALVCADRSLFRGDAEANIDFRPGRFMWKRRFDDGVPRIAQALREERAGQDGMWPPIQAGLVSTSERLEKADVALARRLLTIPRF